MKKSILLLIFVFVTSIIIAVAGCGGDKKEQTEKNETFNCGTQIIVTEYFGEGDNLLNAVMIDANGNEVEIGSGSVRFDKVGSYKLVLKSGTTYIFNIVDTEGPVAVLKEQSTIVYKGDTVKLDLSFADNANSEISVISVKVTFGETEITLDENNSFVAENSGVYKVDVKAKDAAGNENTTVIEIESIETVYGKGIYVIPEQDDADIVVYREKYTEGENAGKYRTVIRKDFNKTGFGYMTIKATKEAGLKSNTYYGLSFTVNSDSDKWAYYNPDNEWLTKKSAPTVNFTVKTDENGEYYKRWWTFSSSSSYFDFSALTFREYVYGTGIDVVATPNQLSGTDITFIEELAADGSGRYVKGIKKAEDKNGFAPLTVSATKDAGLLPNKEYTVVISAELDGAGKTLGAAYYAVDNSWWLPRDKRIELVVTTDENGEFSKTCNCYFADGTYVKFTDVKIIGDYVYGTGINLDLSSNTENITVDNELKDVVNDLYIKKITKDSSKDGFGSLTISATSAAGLKANKQYKVVITTEADGNHPGYYANPDKGEWYISSADGRNKIEITVTTDANGEFSYTCGTYWGSGTYVKFTSITIEKMPEYVYGTGINLDLSSNTESITVDNELKDVVNDLYIKKITKDSSKDGFGSLTISATSAAGLKANKQYKVVITTEADGNHPGYYANPDKGEWYISSADGRNKIEITVTTDANGEFSYTCGTYWGSGTYVKFTSVTVTEVAVEE